MPFSSSVVFATARFQAKTKFTTKQFGSTPKILLSPISDAVVFYL